MAPICPHCGSYQVSEWSNTETSNEGTSNRAVRYFCRNCKRVFTVTEERKHASGMTWLATFDPGGPLREFDMLEIFCNSNGVIYLRHNKKLGRVFSLIVTPSCNVQYRWSGDSREQILYADCTILRMNSELTRNACEKEVFSSIYSEKYDCFELYSCKTPDRRQEMALFLNGVLCTEQSSSEGCYVATCVYGSYDCPEVWTLRRFRDDTLGKCFWGRMFIHTYYAVSPAMVQCFGNTGWFRKLWRGVLDQMVRRLNGKGVEGTPYVDKGWR